MQHPFLIIVDYRLCQGTLAGFSLGLGRALERRGEKVEYFTFSGSNLGGLDPFVGRRFSGIFGVHTPLFTARLPGRGPFIFDYIQGPKLQMVTDNPLGLPMLFDDVPADFHVLAVDDDYRKNILSFFPGVSSAHTFYPGGEAFEVRENAGKQDKSAPEHTWDLEKRDIPLLFVGSYFDYRPLLRELMAKPADIRRLSLWFLRYVNHNPEIPMTEAMNRTLAHFDLHPDGDTLKNLLIAHKDVERIAFYRFRELITGYLLDEGVPLTVTGDTWRSSPFAGHPLLRILPKTDFTELPALFGRTRVSLNLMMTHRSAVTERIISPMLFGAAVASTGTTGLDRAFGENEILTFPYGDKKTLRQGARRVKALLEDEGRLSLLAENAYKKALLQHTWDERAGELLDIIANL